MEPLNEDDPYNSGSYSLNVVIALDELLNALFGGSPHETISARAYKAKERGDLAGSVTVALIDLTFSAIGDDDHCYRVRYNKSAENLRVPWKLLVGIGIVAGTTVAILHRR